MPTVDSLLDQHTAPGAEIGLGVDVVEDQIRRSFNPVMHDAHLKEGHDTYEDYLKESAQTVRRQLESLPDDHRTTINRVFASQPPSPWIEKQLGLEDVPSLFQDHVGALLEQDDEGNYVVGDRHLLNFLDWHNHALAGAQAEVEAIAPQIKQEFADTFRRLVATEGLRESALDNLARLEDTRLFVDDGFNTTVNSILGYAHNSRDIFTQDYHVVFAPTEEDNVATRIHELNHIIEGKDSVIERDKNGQEYALDIAGVEQVFGHDIGGRALREAINEQTTDGMLYGKLDVLNPDAKVRRNATYIAARTLLYTLAEKGLSKVDFKAFQNAQYEDGIDAEQLGEDSAQAQLRKELQEAFPFTDVVGEISRLHVHEGEDADEVILQYAHNLEARAFRHRSLVKRAASRILSGNAPEYTARHRATKDEKSRENSPASIAARI
ncbi:MAG: hypothetical protein JWP13_58 [Candidatus Saccharibacteria bacterium]|nr:hypothetical protein [Candidatus Saccharibacteria bacterium]